MRSPKRGTLGALELFVFAEQFRAAGKLAILIPHLAATQPRFHYAGPNMPQPAAACTAFACELYFKSLIRLDKPSYPEKHDLVDVYSEIEKSRKEKIS